MFASNNIVIFLELKVVFNDCCILKQTTEDTRGYNIVMYSYMSNF